MKTKKMHNFHVPLPDELYTQLRDEALRSNQPATELVRYAIKSWLKAREKAVLNKALSEFVNEYAGTDLDLDEDLETLSIDCLLKQEGEERLTVEIYTGLNWLLAPVLNKEELDL